MGDDDGEEVGGQVGGAAGGATGVGEEVEERAPALNFDEQVGQVDLREPPAQLVVGGLHLRRPLVGVDARHHQPAVFDPYAVPGLGQGPVKPTEVVVELGSQLGQSLFTAERQAGEGRGVGADLVPALRRGQVAGWVGVAPAWLEPEVPGP